MSEPEELESLRARVAALESGVAALARALGMLAGSHRELAESHARGGHSVVKLCDLLLRLLDAVEPRADTDNPPPAPAASGTATIN